ncbi:MAG: DUF969 domain-containing protein [Caulobacter sp.]|nr:DUF969 domain-containing protein [Caulobacter sp.]
MWVLLGVAVVVVGFAARLNPLLIVATAAVVTGVAGGLDVVATLGVLGKAFRDNRYISVVWLILPLIGLLEREGLQERARALISRLREATAGRLLVIYLIIRQLAAAVGLTSLGGHAQMVRPLIAPMAEAAAETRHGDLPQPLRDRIKAMAAATDNVGLFFGEDIFIAIASILLIKGFLEENGIIVEPLHLSMWAIPTAIAALLIHGARLLLLDRQLGREAGR